MAHLAGAGTQRWSSRFIGLLTSRDEAQGAAADCCKLATSAFAGNGHTPLQALGGNVPTADSCTASKGVHARGRSEMDDRSVLRASLVFDGDRIRAIDPAHDV